MGKCTGRNCLTCTNTHCVYDKHAKPLPSTAKTSTKIRTEYYHKYYLMRKKGKKIDNYCKWCGKEVEGEMIRIDGKNYCSATCVLCHLWEKNEKQMKIVKTIK